MDATHWFVDHHCFDVSKLEILASTNFFFPNKFAQEGKARELLPNAATG